MRLPEVTQRYRVDMMVKNGMDGGLPVGSPESAEAIRRVGERLYGKGRWRPGTTLDITGAFNLARTRRAQRDWLRAVKDEADAPI